MDEEIFKKLESQDKKLEEIYRSVEKVRKYFLWTLIITIVVIVIPIIGLLMTIPKFINIINGFNLGL